MADQPWPYAYPEEVMRCLQQAEWSVGHLASLDEVAACLRILERPREEPLWQEVPDPNVPSSLRLVAEDIARQVFAEMDQTCPGLWVSLPANSGTRLFEVIIAKVIAALTP